MNKERLVDEFIELVQTDSETGYEADIATLLKKKFNELGLEVTEDDAANQTDHAANNLVINMPGSDQTVAPIFFTAHMDTVTPGRDIQPQQNNGYITSDGSTILGADDKAGIAVIFEVIRTLKENNITHGDLQFVITVGEESGLVGAKALDADLLKAQYGYALDSDGAIGSIVTTAPYQAKIKAKVTGKTAHAGVAPEKGASAITIAAKSIAKMPNGRIDEETTANIGYFQGGKSTQTNVVVDQVSIVQEARSIQKHKLEAVLEEIQTAYQETAEEFAGDADVEVEWMYPGFRHEADAPVVQVAQQAAKKLGFPSELLKSGGGSDANIFNGHGVPTVNIAVGYENIHTTDERIHTDHLENLTKYVLKIIEQTCTTN
ncbi:MAG TPA: M20/M25/M40 family metallo-hydrolase [Pseudogracilibacillus sp.]|nr:M20/M25/M40 family metallo-hydrolase [Pseudogracilibacillus sp.]